VSKGLLSVVTGNTPGVRGAVADRLLTLAPGAVVLAVSIQARGKGHPTVQPCLFGTGTAHPGRASQGATGDPVVILRQNLLSLRRSTGVAQVVLALPPDGVDVLRSWWSCGVLGWAADHLGRTTTRLRSWSVSKPSRSWPTSAASTGRNDCGAGATR
jgi:hypothetical protein